MLSQTHVQIVSKLSELILQTRVDVKKALFAHLQQFILNFKMHAQQISNTPIIDSLNQLLPKEFYSVKQQLKLKHQGINFSQSIKIQILFNLIQRSSGNKIEAEVWNLQIMRKREIGKESSLMVLQVFKEIILMLNKLPLFSIYQKDKELKSKYMQDYKIIFHNHKESCITDIRAKDFIIKQNHSLRIYMEINYMPSFISLKIANNIMQENQRKLSLATSDYQAEKKVSVYAFYDADLDFTFLSSDDQKFNKLGVGQSIEIKMQMQVVDELYSQQFQLLILNEQQDFLNDNKQIFDSLLQYETQYMTL